MCSTYERSVKRLKSISYSFLSHSGIGLKTEYRSEIDGTISKTVSTYCETHCKSSFTSSSLSAPPSITNSDDPPPPSESVEGGFHDFMCFFNNFYSIYCNYKNIIIQESPGRQLPWKARLKQVRKVLSMWMEMEQPSFVPVLSLSRCANVTVTNPSSQVGILCFSILTNS